MIMLVTFTYLSVEEFFALFIVELVREVEHLILDKHNEV